MSSSANKLTEYQKVKAKEIIAKVILRKGTQVKAAEEVEKALGVRISQPQISSYVKALQQEWLANSQRDIGIIKAQELGKLDLIDAESWEQFDRSKLNAETTTTKLVGVDESKSNKAKQYDPFDDELGDPRDTKLQVQTEETKKVSGQCGDPRYLQILINTTKTRADILGLNMPSKLEVTDWRTEAIKSGATPDQVAELEKISEQLTANITQQLTSEST